MKQTHVIRIETQGDRGRLMVNIYSDYFRQKIPVPIENEPGDLTPAITTAKKHLEKIGYNFTAYCPGNGSSIHYLVSDKFIPLSKPGYSPGFCIIKHSPMKSEHTYIVLDKPATLECIKFSLSKWYNDDAGTRIQLDSTFSIKHGCCIASAFDREVERKHFKNWHSGQAAIEKAIIEWSAKGFKTREELGIIVNNDLAQDQSVYDIWRQIFEMYIKDGGNTIFQETMSRLIK